MKVIIGAGFRGVRVEGSADPPFDGTGHRCEGYWHFYNEAGELTDPAQRDYPVVAQQVARPVAEGAYDFGIILCGTGIGVGMTANKLRGVRAATVVTAFEANLRACTTTRTSCAWAGA